MKGTSIALMVCLLVAGAAQATPILGTYENIITEPQIWEVSDDSPSGLPDTRVVGSQWDRQDPFEVGKYVVHINNYTGEYTPWQIVWFDSTATGSIILSNMPDDPWFEAGDTVGSYTYIGTITDYQLEATYSEFYKPLDNWTGGIGLAGHVELTAQITALFEGTGYDPFYGTFDLSYSGVPTPTWCGAAWPDETYRIFSGYYGPLDSATLTIESAVVPEPASMTLVGLGMAALAFKTLRKRTRG